MAISFVGSYTAGVTSTDMTVLFSSLRDAADVEPTVLEGDTVIFVGSRRDTADVPVTLVTTGYSALFANIYVNGTNDINLRAYSKVMGATPDTQVVITGASNGNVSTFCLYVFRGVGTITVGSNATGSGVHASDAPSVTPTVAGSWPMALAGAAGPNTAGATDIYTNPANASATTNHFRSALVTRSATGVALKTDWSSGAFDFDAFGGGSDLSTCTDAAQVLVLEPSSSDVTVGITGQALSAAQGSLAPATDKALTGQAVSAAQGTVAFAEDNDVTVALTGQSLSAAQGSLAPAIDLALTGQTLAAGQGSVIPVNSLALTGQSLTAAQGTLAPAFDKALSGQALTLAQGTLTFAGDGDITVALTGLGLGVSQGSLAVEATVGLTGQELALGQGTLAVGALPATDRIKGRKLRRALADWRRRRKLAVEAEEPQSEAAPIFAKPARIAAQADFTALEAEVAALRAQVAQGEQKRLSKALSQIEAAFGEVQAELAQMQQDDEAWLARLRDEDEILLLAA